MYEQQSMEGWVPSELGIVGRPFVGGRFKVDLGSIYTCCPYSASGPRLKCEI